MKPRKYIFFGILVLMFLGHTPLTHIDQVQTQPTKSSNQPVSLYKFNALTDTASNLQLNNVYPLTKGKGMLIAEIDTGVSTMYESHIFHNNNESLDGHDDDHNGYIDDVRGWNALADNNNTYDNSITYHGTEVASIILQTAPNATILPIKYVSSNNQISSTDIYKLNNALDYASLFHPDIIVMAFNFNVETPTTILTRLQNFQNNGTIIVVSAGNCVPGDITCQYVHSPADNPYVSAIGSIASDLSHSDFSVQGPKLDYSLFGQDVTVYSPYFPSGTLENGTSFSVAEAGGIFALYKAMYLEKYSTFNLTDFMDSISITARELGSSTLYGRGLPQIFTAFKALYDSDYPQLLDYTYSQVNTQLLINLRVDDQSGLGNCTYTIKDQHYGMNQSCTGMEYLPIVSNNNNIAQYSFLLSNISDLMQMKLYLTDLHYHTDSYTLQISITLTSQNTDATNSVNSSSYIVRSNGQNTTQSESDSTIGIFSVSNSTKPRTSPFFDVNILFLSLITLIFLKKYRSKKS